MEFKTERLILREFVEEDWRDVLAYQSDPRYLEYYPWSERSAEDVQEFVRRQIELQSQRPRIKFQLVLVLKSEDKLIGNCGIRMDTPEAHQADIGYELSPQYWGQGYATEAAQALVEYGFTQLNLHRIWSWCIADNSRSVRVLEKLGMRQEGRLRENEFFKGRWWDTLVFGILEDEWREQQVTDLTGFRKPVRSH
jgi:RimJ/RimL family protein N-acetyltransferase